MNQKGTKMANPWIVVYTCKTKCGGVIADMSYFNNHGQALAFVTELTNRSNVITAMVISIGDEPEIDVRYEKWGD